MLHNDKFNTNNSNYDFIKGKGGSPEQVSSNAGLGSLTPSTQYQIDQLKQTLKKVKYNRQVHSKDLLTGSSGVYLPIIHYTLLVFSKQVQKYLEQKGYNLYAKSDYQFMDEVYSMLDKLFSYKPSLSQNQFFLSGYPELKIQFCNDLISLIRNKHSLLGKRSSSVKENVNAVDSKTDNHKDKGYQNKPIEVINQAKKGQGEMHQQLKGQKSVRFLDKNDTNEPLRDKNNTINQTIDDASHQRGNSRGPTGRMELLDMALVKRGGSPQPQPSSYLNRKVSACNGQNIQVNQKNENTHTNIQSESCPNTVRGENPQVNIVSTQDQKQNLNTNDATNEVLNAVRKAESQKNKTSKNIIFKQDQVIKFNQQVESTKNPATKGPIIDYQIKKDHQQVDYLNYNTYMNRGVNPPSHSSKDKNTNSSSQGFPNSSHNQIDQVLVQNRELTNAVSQLNESLRIMNQNFTKFQKYVEDKFSKMEVEQTELKNRLLNYEKMKINERSPSISPNPNNRTNNVTITNTLESRTKDDQTTGKSNTKADNIYSHYTSRYRSEKRQTTAQESIRYANDLINNQPSSKKQDIIDTKYLDEEYIQNLRKNYSSNMHGSNGFTSTRHNHQAQNDSLSKGDVRATGEFRTTITGGGSNINETSTNNDSHDYQNKNMSNSSDFIENFQHKTEKSSNGGAADQTFGKMREKALMNDFVSLRRSSRSNDRENRQSLDRNTLRHNQHQAPLYHYDRGQDEYATIASKRLSVYHHQNNQNHHHHQYQESDSFKRRVNVYEQNLNITNTNRRNTLGGRYD